MQIPEHRMWMYSRLHPRRAGLRKKFVHGVGEFINHAKQQPQFAIEDGKLRCPCAKHENNTFLTPDEVMVDLYKRGFKPRYWYWDCHGECSPIYNNNVDNVSLEATTSSEASSTGSQPIPDDLIILKEAVPGKKKRSVYNLGSEGTSFTATSVCGPSSGIRYWNESLEKDIIEWKKKDEEQRYIIQEQKKKIEGQQHIIQGQQHIIQEQQHSIEGLNHIIEKQRKIMEERQVIEKRLAKQGATIELVLKTLNLKPPSNFSYDGKDKGTVIEPSNDGGSHGERDEDDAQI